MLTVSIDWQSNYSLDRIMTIFCQYLHIQENYSQTESDKKFILKFFIAWRTEEWSLSLQGETLKRHFHRVFPAKQTLSVLLRSPQYPQDQRTAGGPERSSRSDCLERLSASCTSQYCCLHARSNSVIFLKSVLSFFKCKILFFPWGVGG